MQLRERLRAQQPQPMSPTLLHGDWRLGNMLFLRTAVQGVIDWEIWSIADPRIDLAWFLMMCDTRHPGALPTSTTSSGMPDVASLTDEYAQQAGAPIRDLAWFRALVAYKQIATTALIARNAGKHGKPMETVTGRLNGMLPDLLDWAMALLDES
jgi:aminoglycoside phosphotransferase (APT) family kinase protein